MRIIQLHFLRPSHEPCQCPNCESSSSDEICLGGQEEKPEPCVIQDHDKSQPDGDQDHFQHELATAESEVALLPGRRQKLRLLELPLELILLVLKKCDPRTLMALRGVCKFLEEHVQAMFTSKAFERHVLRLFISLYFYKKGNRKDLICCLENLDMFTISVRVTPPNTRSRDPAKRTKARNSQKWYFGTESCSNPSCVNSDGFIPALPHHSTPDKNCMATRLWRFGYKFENPSSSLEKGLKRAFGPKFLLKLFLVLMGYIEDYLEDEHVSIYKALEENPSGDPSRDQAFADEDHDALDAFVEATLRRHEEAFEIESDRDWRLECHEAKRDLADVLAEHDHWHTDRNPCYYHAFAGFWYCSNELL